MVLFTTTTDDVVMDIFVVNKTPVHHLRRAHRGVSAIGHTDPILPRLPMISNSAFRY